MAQVITLPRAPNTGISNLGSAIFSGIVDMTDRQRAEQLHERQRLERAQDIQDQRDYQRGVVREDRDYSETLRGRIRGEALADETRRREEAVKDLLVRELYLTPAQRNDVNAVAAAFARAQRDGLMERYKDLLDAGTGLTMENLDNPTAVDSARQQLSEVRALEADRLRGLPAKAQKSVDFLVAQDGQLAAESLRLSAEQARVESQLAAPQPRPTVAQIQSRAVQLAQAANGGKTPSRDDIAAQMPPAEQELAQQLMIEWGQNRQDAITQAQILAAQRATIGRERENIRARLNTLEPQFRVVGEPGAPAPAPQAANLEANLREVGEPYEGDGMPVNDFPTVQKSVLQNLASRRPAGAPAAAAAPAPAAAPTPASAPRPPPAAAPAAPRKDYQYSGGLLGLLERMPTNAEFSPEPVAPLTPAQVGRGVSRMAEIPTRLDRAGGAIATGLLTGDYSVPARGGLEQLGQAWGDVAMADQDRHDDWVLRMQPTSREAQAIRRKRGIPEPVAPGEAIRPPATSNVLEARPMLLWDRAPYFAPRGN